MVERKLRIGVTGAGYFGRFHALKVAASPRAVLVGVHDADAARAAAVAVEAGSVGLGFAELLAGSDALVVAAPAAVHFELAGAALRAGRHVLVEKPIAATLAEADGLAALAAARGLVLQVGHLERFSAAFSAVRARLRQNGAGLVRRIEASRVAPFKERGTDVSVVLDLMIHDLDLVLALVGAEPVRVAAEGAVGRSGRLDRVTARLGFPDGAEAVVIASREAPSVERRMRVESEGSVLEVDFVGRTVTERVAGRADVTHAWTDHDSLAAEHAAFVASVLDGATVVVDAADGRAALAVALAVEAAALGSE
jgi:predicted dehydrogenase